MATITVRVVALGRDNGVQVAVIKTFGVELQDGESAQQAAQRKQTEIQGDLRDFIRDAFAVTQSDIQVSIGVVR